MNVMGKAKTSPFKNIEFQTREILLRNWDPIGVESNPNLADEYDRYLPQILKVVCAPNSTVELVEAALLEIENGLGMLVPKQARHKTSLSLMLLVDFRNTNG